MKVSKEQKAKTKRKLIEAAVDLIMEEGYQKATMKKIAKAAGVGPATIYKYFPSKEKLLIGFYVLKAQDAVADLEEIGDFEEYTLKEKLQTLIEGYLEHLLVDRDFVLESLSMIIESASLAYNDTTPIKKEFKEVIEGFVSEAVESGEIEDVPFGDIIPELICHYVMGVLMYWTKDESEEFADTTQMIDLSLEFGYLVLKSGMINKAFDVGSFFFKTLFFKSFWMQGGLLKKLFRSRAAFGGGF